MGKCKVCGNDTEVVFNIKFKATPVCESCATSIFLQQAKWYVENSNMYCDCEEPIPSDYEGETFCTTCGGETGQ